MAHKSLGTYNLQKVFVSRTMILDIKETNISAGLMQRLRCVLDAVILQEMQQA